MMRDGKGGSGFDGCKADYELIIGSESRDYFMEKIGFLTDEKNTKYRDWKLRQRNTRREKFASLIATIEYVGREAVFDTTHPDKNNFIFNDILTANFRTQP